MAADSPADRGESNVLRRFYSEIEAVLDPAAVARKLWQGGVLTEGQLDEAELASTSLAQRKSDLMSAVRKVVRGDPGKIWILVETLEQFPVSGPIARRMKEELNRAKPEPILLTTTTSAPAATTTETSAFIPQVYQGDFEDLQGQFVRLFAEVAKEFEKEESVTAENLKNFLSYYPDIKASLVHASCISDVMLVLQNHSTFICCSRLKNVAEHFKIPAVTEKIEVYFQYLDDFRSRKMTKIINELKPFVTAKSIVFLPSTTITFKLEWNPDDKTLSDIQSVLRQAFHERSIYVHIVVVKGGSVRLICCSPQYLMAELVRLAQKNKELLVESSVTYLRVGNTIVVDTSDQNQISLVKDLVLQLTIALQLKDNNHSDDRMKSMTHSSASEPSSSIWQITRDEAEYILTYKPDGTFLVRKTRGEPITDPSSSSINTHDICVIINGRVEHLAIHKRGNYYGSLDDEKYTSVEHLVAVISRAGFSMHKGTTLVTLTHQLSPDKDTLANLPSDIPTITLYNTFRDVASLVPKHFPHHDESTWLCRQLSKEESEKLLRGRIDETFLVRATDLSGPSHLFTVDIVLQRKVISLGVYRDGDWLGFEGMRERYDSIHTLVMCYVIAAAPIPIGDHNVLVYFRYPVHSSKYYK